jgi:hypothetical protein
LPSLKRNSVLVFVFCVLPCSALPASVVGLVWYRANRGALTLVPALYSGLAKVGLGVGFGQSVLVLLVALFYSAFRQGWQVREVIGGTETAALNCRLSTGRRAVRPASPIFSSSKLRATRLIGTPSSLAYPAWCRARAMKSELGWFIELKYFFRWITLDGPRSVG